MRREKPVLHKFVCFQMHNKKVSCLKSFNIWVRNNPFLSNYVTSEEAVSHNMFYYQQLSVARWIQSKLSRIWKFAWWKYDNIERFAVTPCNDYLVWAGVVLKRTVGFNSTLRVETNDSIQNHPNSLEIVITWCYRKQSKFVYWNCFEL